jgi:hypothetical protein
MKIIKLIPFMLLVLGVVFVSCNKGPEKLIVKTWKVTDVVAKGTINETDFQQTKAELMKVIMTFRDQKYTMKSNGNAIESGTYSVQDGKLVVKTEAGMNMDATVTKVKLNLETPDFTIMLQPE